jgi:thioredoxin reductase
MRYDAIIVGGSFAGLSAAIYLARARRSVCIVDAVLPRNRFAAHSHGFFAHDGSGPLDMIARARSQVAAYPTTTFVDASAITATRESDGFAVRLARNTAAVDTAPSVISTRDTPTGDTLESTALVLAFGVSDELPEIPGLAERWGSTVIHCPYCHGYEFSGRRLGVLNLSPASVHQAMLVAEWGPTTFFLHGESELDDATQIEFRRRRIDVVSEPVIALHGTTPALSAIELRDGRTVPIDALYVGPRNRLNSELASELGCTLDEGPLGHFIRTDAMQLTTVPGVYAAGDITRAMHNVTFASADGVMAGTALHRSLVF